MVASLPSGLHLCSATYTCTCAYDSCERAEQSRNTTRVHMRACAKVLRDVFFASHAGRRRERSSGVLAQESCK